MKRNASSLDNRGVAIGLGGKLDISAAAGGFTAATGAVMEAFGIFTTGAA